jgi:propanol-preferring alcohol dehydrogenase
MPGIGKTMPAAVLNHAAPAQERPLILEPRPVPEPGLGEVLLRVRACGVCRTDMHIVEGELPSLQSEILPGHQPSTAPLC